MIAAFLLAPVAGASQQSIRLESVGRVLVAGIPLSVGIYAWRGVPFGRFGAGLAVTALVWLLTTFALADRAIVYSIGRVAAWVGWAALVYLVVAFPNGRVTDRVDRVLVVVVASILVVLWLPSALFVNRYPVPSEWVTCSAGCPRNAFMVLSHQPRVLTSVVVPVREFVTVVAFLAVVVRLIQRIAAASRLRRRTLAPVLVVAVAGIAVLTVFLIVRRFAPASQLLGVLRWVAAFALPAIAIAFLIGLLRWRLYVGASLRRFAATLGSRLQPEDLRRALAEAFEDPGLEIVYPLAGGGWARADGRPTDAPVPAADTAISDVRNGSGQVIAALVHDPALQGEQAFINAVGSYAALTLENHGLAADVANLARGMRETQARAGVKADQAREDIERDLHDGAQQRLIGLGIKLHDVAERSGNDPVASEQLTRLGAEVQAIIDELRRLARGLFPRVLSDLGPVAALRETARSAPLPTTVSGRLGDRYAAEIERAVYFCCLEALQNAYKHGGAATVVRVRLVQHEQDLAFEVTDDGEGFDPDLKTVGAGLQNMHDRVALLGGALVIDSAPGEGTRVTGIIPLPEPMGGRAEHRPS